MLTFEEAQIVLDEIAAALPQEIFAELNGGYMLTPDVVEEDGGYILGQYHVQIPGLGRYIAVHYGSIVKMGGRLCACRFREKLKEVLHHELTHHIESLAGDKSLEIQDELERARARRRSFSLRDLS